MSEPVGIIYPHSDLRVIVDNTAKYVAKNGRAFEERIMREHKGKPKFSFLFPDDPFHAYYKHKVNEVRNAILAEVNSKRTDDHETDDNSRQAGRSHEQEDNKPDDSDNNDEKHDRQNDDNYHPQDRVTNHNSDLPDQNDRLNDQESNRREDDNREGNLNSAPGVRTALNDYMQEITLKLEEPPHLNYLAKPASFITHLENDIIRLTAQYIATYGRPFLLELASREQGNPRFDFLRPQHGQFPYMTRLIMQYALIENPPLDILEQLEKDSTSQKHVLDRCKLRAEWNKMLELEKKKKKEAEEREKLLYSQIDWHDFVIVETIDYPYNETGEYPPTTPDQVGTRLLMQQRKEDLSAPEDMDMDMDVESDNESAHSDEREASRADEFAAPYPPDVQKVVIRRDYDPKAATAKSNTQPDSFVSPITNERIPYDKIDEHVRYNLADPRYLEKKEKSLQDRIKEDAVYASGSQIQDSLKNLMERRTDIHGLDNEEAAIGRRIGEEKDEQPKDNKLLWDGHKSSIKRKKLN